MVNQPTIQNRRPLTRLASIDRVTFLEGENALLTAKIQADSETMESKLNEYNGVNAEYKEVESEFENLRRLYEAETLARVQSEATIQNLRDELTLKESSESTNRIKMNCEIVRLAKQYESKFQQSLQELREEMRVNRNEIA